jgi:hypothetical protein
MKPFKLKYNPINIDEKQFTEWLIALWENKYPQTKGGLQDGFGYCCLGVACKELIPQNEIKMFDGYIEGGMPKEQNKSPEWLKAVNNATYNLTGVALFVLNDDHDFTFPEIADVLYQVYVLGEYTTEGY